MGSSLGLLNGTVLFISSATFFSLLSALSTPESNETDDALIFAIWDCVFTVSYKSVGNNYVCPVRSGQ